jgi:hypothetical protein
VGWLAEKLTDLCRPWHDDGLPDELAFGEIEAWGFVRGSMDRAARLAVSEDVPFGVFGIIGIAYARRAARAWWPKERLLMEDISCAFHPVAARAWEGQLVPPLLLDRLVFVLARYLAYVGPPWEEEEIREAVERFIREMPRKPAEDEEQSEE